MVAGRFSEAVDLLLINMVPAADAEIEGNSCSQLGNRERLRIGRFCAVVQAGSEPVSRLRPLRRPLFEERVDSLSTVRTHETPNEAVGLSSQTVGEGKAERRGMQLLQHRDSVG